MGSVVFVRVSKFGQRAAACTGLAALAVAQSGLVMRGSHALDSDVLEGPCAALDAGLGQTFALRSDGTLSTWGVSLGAPPPLPPGVTFVEARAGGEDYWGTGLPPYGVQSARFGIARLSDGNVVAWGSNAGGVLAVPALPASVTYVSVSAGGTHALALRSDGTVVAWGRTNEGQCAVPALPAGMSYTAVAAGGRGGRDYFHPIGHSAALRSDGSAVAWGENSHGQCDVPTLPPGLTFVGLAAGATHTLGLRSDGAVLAWGLNLSGQCDVPPLPGGVTYTQVAAGAIHSAALRSDGAIVAWGSNGTGACDVPGLPPGRRYVAVSAGGSHTVALRADGAVVAWGDNSAGQCSVPGTFLQLAGGGHHYQGYYQNFEPRPFWLALRSDGSLVAWGDNSAGQCTPPSAPAGRRFVEIAAGAKHALARLDDGSVLAWGDDSEGQCSVPALPPGQTFVAIAAGGCFIEATEVSHGHSLALSSDGTLLAWGDNEDGACDVPALPPGVTYVAMSAGGFHSLAARSDGGVEAWGHDGWAQCSVPALPSGRSVVEVSAGGTHSLARLDDGSVLAWGDDSWGQCDVPALPSGLTYVALRAGPRHSLALRSDGELVGWGLAGCGTQDLPALPPGTSRADFAAGLYTSLTSYTASCGFARSFCIPGVTSGGCVPTIHATGTASGSAGSGFTISVSSVDGQRNGLILYGLGGATFVPAPWASGNSSFLCVRPPLQRTLLSSSGGTLGACDGTLSLDWNAYVASHPAALGAPFLSAGDASAQGWFRDPLAPRGSNLSDALRFRYCP